MKKRIAFIIVFLLLLGGYGVFIYKNNNEDTGSKPEISVSSDILNMSVSSDEKVLTEGVKALDKEDGDITSNIFVEDISEFDEEMCRTITYGVFDSDDNFARETRRIKYIDYKKPEFSLKQPLCFYYVKDKERMKSYITANSVVDGDITSKVIVQEKSQNKNDNYVTFVVEDSCGQKSDITLKVDYLTRNPQIDIQLTQYLIKVPKGTQIDPMGYISSIGYMGEQDKSLYDKLKIQSDYNPNESGTYEFVYNIEEPNGSYGFTKLVVIVD